MTSKSKISNDKPRNVTKESLDIDGAISGQGRSGGRLARDVGSRDELKRSKERPAGKTASSSCRRSSQGQPGRHTGASVFLVRDR
jgi:hypothetical protein